jgi:hypothetical protein
MGVCVSGKVKTTIVIDKELWIKFKARILEEGVGKVSRVIEKIIREEMLEDYIIASIQELMSREPPLEVKPIKPIVETEAGKVVREMRDMRI